jgi:hypothetical protein
MLSVAVTVFDTFPSINCLYDQSSFHWQLHQDSSSPLVITLQLLEFSSRFHHCVLAVTTSQLWLLWILSPFLHETSGCDLGPFTRVLRDFSFHDILLRVPLNLPTHEILNTPYRINGPYLSL